LWKNILRIILSFYFAVHGAGFSASYHTQPSKKSNLHYHLIIRFGNYNEAVNLQLFLPLITNVYGQGDFIMEATPSPCMPELSEVTSYDVFYERANTVCKFPKEWFELVFHSPEDQVRRVLPRASLRWLGAGQQPVQCNICHIPQYELRVEKSQQRPHQCVFVRCTQFQYCLNPHANKCTT